jgi:O6-methylguanine-DNA--protein-cysteine methyltransferase
MCEWVVAECAEGLDLRLTASHAGLRSIDFDLLRPPVGEPGSGNVILEESVRQLRAYFAGALRVFTIPLDPRGTDF